MKKLMGTMIVAVAFVVFGSLALLSARPAAAQYYYQPPTHTVCNWVGQFLYCTTY